MSTTTLTAVASTTTTPPLPSTTNTVQNLPPAQVGGLTASIGGGSLEVIPVWDRVPEPDIDHYNVWYSLQPSGIKTLLDNVAHAPGLISAPAYNVGGGRIAYVDYPRNQVEGTECYQISAVDNVGNEGVRSVEVCLPLTPPAVVTGLTVGVGGGSLEVFLTWERGTEPDLSHYNIWYSEIEGVSKTHLDSVNHNPGSLQPPAYDNGSGVTAYIDYPRDLVNGEQCYQISAVDVGGSESARTTEICLSGL